MLRASSVARLARALPSDDEPPSAGLSASQVDADGKGASAGKPQVRLGAVNVALAKGNLLCVAELLEWEWRAKGQGGGAKEWCREAKGQGGEAQEWGGGAKGHQNCPKLNF